MIKMTRYLKTVIFWGKESCHLLIAIILLGSLFYIRLLPKVSRDLWEQLSYSQAAYLVVNIGLILLNVYLLLKTLNVLVMPEKNTSFFTFFVKRVRKLPEYFFWTFRNLYRFLEYILDYLVLRIFDHPFFIYQSMRKIFQNVLHWNKYILFCSLISLKVIPKLLFLWAFCYDVLFAKHLHFTFQCIPWLLVPFLEDFIIFLFKNFNDSYWDQVRTCVLETKCADNNISKYEFIPQFKENLPYSVTSLSDFFDNHIMVFVNIQQFLSKYHHFKHHIFHYFHLILLFSIIRLCILIYLLFYGIF